MRQGAQSEQQDTHRQGAHGSAHGGHQMEGGDSAHGAAGMEEMGGMEEMDAGHGHDAMIRAHHEKMLWTTLTSILLGVWLVVSPITVRYGSPALAWSDGVTGALIVAFGLLALSPRLDLARWGICIAGIWLLLAPVVFWAPTPYEYLNDTLVGALAIALSVLVPMMPGKAHHMAMMAPGPEVPPGWSYNPSSWLQRAPMIALAFISFFLARYLTAYQLGHVDWVWDPFFGAGTVAVLGSEVSRAFPISDAGLGAFTYVIEALSGYMGGKTRWRTMPWMVLMFGVLVVPLGVVSITLIILQPVSVGAWCTLCLGTAGLMLAMIPLAVDEVAAMGLFMWLAYKAGKPLWRTFWVGGTLDERNEDGRTPRLTALPSRLAPAMAWGVTLPWTLIVSAALGLWLMAAPAVFDTGGRAADSNHIVGPLATTFAVIAMGEVTRAARYVNVLLGAWIVAAPWLLGGAGMAAAVNNAAVGVALILLSLPRGHIRERYGLWDRYVV
jgi:uncharacterized membrane protein